ncbi:hypothetical protein BHE74_00009776 [Ensete ventricosum]|nr:hypothetical protein BHE74_00009776 [Ensete ventricosum]
MHARQLAPDSSSISLVPRAGVNSVTELGGTAVWHRPRRRVLLLVHLSPNPRHVPVHMTRHEGVGVGLGTARATQHVARRCAAIPPPYARPHRRDLWLVYHVRDMFDGSSANPVM